MNPSNPTGQCPKCRTDNPYTLAFCSFCGERLPWAGTQQAQPVSRPVSAPVPPQSDGLAVLYAVLGFFLPLVGFILWLVSKNDNPRRASGALWGAVAGTALTVVIAIGTIGVLTMLGHAVKDEMGVRNAITSNAPAAIEPEIQRLYNEQLQVQGAGITCTSLTLKEAAPNQYTGTATLSNGGTAQMTVTLTPNGEAIWQAVPVQ